jgi:hypothetical protein
MPDDFPNKEISMLQLQVASTDVTNGNLAVAWCVDAQVLKELSDRDIEDPQVVIVVSPTENYHISKEYRKVVPLKDLMTYVEFRASGPNKIWAYISRRAPAKSVRNAALTRECGQFSTDILTMDGSGYNTDNHSLSERELFYATPISVVVPQAVFAREPAKWEKTWVNHWFRSKPQDQCDFRRRRLLAYTVQPLAILLDVLVVRTVALLLSSLWLSRGMSLKFHAHPLRYGIGDIVDVFRGGSWTIPTLPEDQKSGDPDLTASYLFRKLWKTPLMPVVLFPLWLIIHFKVIIWAAAATAVILSIVGLALLFASGTVMAWIKSLKEWQDSRQEVISPWYLEKDEMDVITCNPNMKNRTSISALPAKHRTIHLRFQDLKAKVCRPFSS